MGAVWAKKKLMTPPAAMDEAREILADVASRRQTIHYKELALQIKSERIHWRGAKLGDLLGRLAEEEWRAWRAGRGLLSAVVTLKGSGIPSDGFFRMAARVLGRKIRDPHSFWEKERESVYTAHTPAREYA